mmetsp:Transcript_40705/g.122602  ORF Transcript_40705/g.122602 Transcript_40705/m.122602 type:complete len:241 (-) Transcript_40705:555-1277(-)
MIGRLDLRRDGHVDDRHRHRRGLGTLGRRGQRPGGKVGRPLGLHLPPARFSRLRGRGHPRVALLKDGLVFGHRRDRRRWGRCAARRSRFTPHRGAERHPLREAGSADATVRPQAMVRGLDLGRNISRGHRDRSRRGCGGGLDGQGCGGTGRPLVLHVAPARFPGLGRGAHVGVPLSEQFILRGSGDNGRGRGRGGGGFGRGSEQQKLLLEFLLRGGLGGLDGRQFLLLRLDDVLRHELLV